MLKTWNPKTVSIEKLPITWFWQAGEVRNYRGGVSSFDFSAYLVRRAVQDSLAQEETKLIARVGDLLKTKNYQVLSAAEKFKFNTAAQHYTLQLGKAAPGLLSLYLGHLKNNGSLEFVAFCKSKGFTGLALRISE